MPTSSQNTFSTDIKILKKNTSIWITRSQKLERNRVALRIFPRVWQVKATIIWKFQRNVIGLFCGRHRLRHMLTYLRHFECKTRHDATYKSEHISRLFCEIVNRQSVSVHNDLRIGVITLWAPLIIYYGTALSYYNVSYSCFRDHV